MGFSRQVIVFLVAAVFSVMEQRALGEKFYDWLSSSRVPSDLSMTKAIALKDLSRIKSMTRQKYGLALAFPTNSAWNRKRSWHSTLSKDGNHELRWDMIMGSSSEVQGIGWEHLKTHIKSNGGMIDTAYGTSYIIDTVANPPKMCLVEYDASYNPKRGECGRIILPPYEFDDATVYKVDKVLVSPELASFIHEAVGGRRLRV